MENQEEEKVPDQVEEAEADETEAQGAEYID